jgi:GDPmannose 4,6-dehydratase
MQWLMLQQDEPDGYVIAIGRQYSVRQCIEQAAKNAGIQIKWQGNGIDEIGIDTDTGNVIVEIDSRYFRPTEVDTLLGDSTKAKEKLGWEPKIRFEEMIAEMVRTDLKEAKRDKLVQSNGFELDHR